MLDVGTGTGALALAAARAGAVSVTAVDVSLRSVAAAWLNSRLHRVACTVHWGDLCALVAGQQFDLILANPPLFRRPPMSCRGIGSAAAGTGASTGGCS